MGTTPKTARPCQAPVDHTPHGPFDRPTPKRKLHGQELGIRHAVLVLDTIVMMLTDRLLVAASAAVPHCRHALLHLAPPQPATLLGAPPRAGCGAPVRAPGRHLAEAVRGMLKVQQCMPLRSRQTQRVSQEWDALPNPRRALGDQEDLVRLGNRESRQVGAQQGKHCVRPLTRRVNHGRTTGCTLARGLYHIDAQPLGFTPCPCLALASFGGLGAPLRLAQPQATTIPADHDPTSRHSVLKHGCVELLLEPRPGRLAVGEQPPRLGIERHAPVGQHSLRLGQSAQHRRPPAHLSSQRWGTTIVNPPQHQTGLDTRVAPASASLTLAAVVGSPYRHPQPGRCAHPPFRPAIVLERLGPRLPQLLVRGLQGRGIQRLWEMRPAQ